MATVVEVPKLGNTVEECIVSGWLKRKGDAIAVGDLVAEIETDKATFEVTSPVAGILLETLGEVHVGGFEDLPVPDPERLLIGRLMIEPGTDARNYNPTPCS